MLPRQFQALLDEFHILFSGCDAAARFLLERVQYVDGLAECHRIDRPERIAFMISDHFEHSRTTEPTQRLCVRMFIACLSKVQRIADQTLNVIRKPLAEDRVMVRKSGDDVTRDR